VAKGQSQSLKSRSGRPHSRSGLQVRQILRLYYTDAPLMAVISNVYLSAGCGDAVELPCSLMEPCRARPPASALLPPLPHDLKILNRLWPPERETRLQALSLPLRATATMLAAKAATQNPNNVHDELGRGRELEPWRRIQTRERTQEHERWRCRSCPFLSLPASA
jgi:hypothetical protein